MEFKIVNAANIEEEHICCAIAGKKGDDRASAKKAWLEDRFQDGLVFLKADARGKAFIEYLPAESAWCPLVAPDYLYIDCFWVSGQLKGQGIAGELLARAVKDAEERGKAGLCILSSPKKMPFLSDPKFLKYKGFQLADQAEPYFELLYLPLKENAAPPKFCESAKKGRIDEKGMVLYYSNQCPHAEMYAKIIAEMAAERGTELKLIKLETKEQAQKAPSPFTTYSFFYDGNFITNEILSEKKFLKFMEEHGI